MLSHPTITDEQRTSFESDGFLHIPHEQHNLIGDVNELQNWTEDILSWPRDKGKWMPYDELNTKGNRQIMRTEKVVDYFPPVKLLLCGDKLLSLLKQLTGKDALLFKDKINYKLPGANGFVAHIDAPAYYHMGEMPFIEVMVVVDPQTPENGCLEFVRGSHKVTPKLANGGRLAEDWEASHEFTKLNLNSGDIVIFGSRLAHRSGPNLTDRRRAAIFGTYHFETDQPDMRERYWAHRRIHFPPDHERREGEDYKAGFKLFAYSSPFTKPELATETTMG